jgi:hypothetical protein
MKSSKFNKTANRILNEELDGPVVSALCVRTWKLSNVRKGPMDDQNFISRARALPCFGRHVKLLVPAAFAVVSIHSSFKDGCCQLGRRPIVKIVAESLSQHDDNMLYRPHLLE